MPGSHSGRYSTIGCGHNQHAEAKPGEAHTPRECVNKVCTWCNIKGKLAKHLCYEVNNIILPIFNLVSICNVEDQRCC